MQVKCKILSMQTKDIIKQLESIQAGIEGDTYTYEAIQALINKIK